MKLKQKAIDAFIWGVKEGRIEVKDLPKPYQKVVQEELKKYE